MNLCEFEASLVYIVNSRTVRAMYRDLVSNKSTVLFPFPWLAPKSPIISAEILSFDQL